MLSPQFAYLTSRCWPRQIDLSEQAVGSFRQGRVQAKRLPNFCQRVAHFLSPVALVPGKIRGQGLLQFVNWLSQYVFYRVGLNHGDRSQNVVEIGRTRPMSRN